MPGGGAGERAEINQMAAGGRKCMDFKAKDRQSVSEERKPVFLFSVAECSR